MDHTHLVNGHFHVCIRSYDHAASIMQQWVVQHSTCLRMSAVKPVAYLVKLVVSNKRPQLLSRTECDEVTKLVSGLSMACILGVLLYMLLSMACILGVLP